MLTINFISPSRGSKKLHTQKKEKQQKLHQA